MKNTLFAFFIVISMFAQHNYPKDYFISPLDVQLYTTGNFGELRNNHFHSGLDFATNRLIGLNVFAVADGYVSRIKISHGGYGKAIYITHPNGYTSVYAHLQKGHNKLESYIRKHQYLQKSYEIELFLKPNELPVKKGEQIAFTGNTGSSSGPHLHFEIRDTETEKIINPLFFGYDLLIEDSKKPYFKGVYVYPLDDNSIVNQSSVPILLNYNKIAEGEFIAEKVFANGRIGFGVEAYDSFDINNNVNGVYKVESYINGSSCFEYQFDAFSFDETRYVNALIDYEKYKKEKERVQRLFALKSYPLSIVNSKANLGVINVNSNMNISYKIEIFDFHGNKSKLIIPIVYANNLKQVIAKPNKSKYYIKSDRESMFKLENVSVTFPENTFYNDIYLDFEVKKGIAQVHKDIVPIHNSFIISFEDSTIAENDRSKMFIGNLEGKKVNYYKTKFYKNSYSVYSKTLGNYQLLKDSIPPKIEMKNEIEGKWLSQNKTLNFYITDDLSGINTYEGYLNGKWILLEYEYKENKLTHYFSDGIVAEGKNDLKLIVTDNVGNSTIFETHFYRSQKP